MSNNIRLRVGNQITPTCCEAAFPAVQAFAHRLAPSSRALRRAVQNYYARRRRLSRGSPRRCIICAEVNLHTSQAAPVGARLYVASMTSLPLDNGNIQSTDLRSSLREYQHSSASGCRDGWSCLGHSSAVTTRSLSWWQYYTRSGGPQLGCPPFVCKLAKARWVPARLATTERSRAVLDSPTVLKTPFHCRDCPPGVPRHRRHQHSRGHSH